MNKNEFNEKLTELADLKPKSSPASLDIEIKKIKFKSAECQLGCGRIVKNQVIEKQYITYPVKHTRVRCSSCFLCIHPSGKGFIHQNSFQSEFKRFLEDRDK